MKPLNITAARWARVPWSVKAKRRRDLVNYVKACEAAHVARYGYGHPQRNRGNSNVRTGAFNAPKEFAA